MKNNYNTELKDDKNKNIVKSILLIAAIVVVVCFVLGKNKIFSDSSIDVDDKVSTGTIIETNSKDINSVNEEITSDNDNDNDKDNPSNDGVVSDDKDENHYFIEGDFLSDGSVSEIERSAMSSNTEYLQELVNTAKEGQTIKLPAGTFYFSSGGINTRGYENYVIKLNNNVKIVGAGIDESSSNGYTLLKPYADNGTIQNGLDMFYFNELSDSYGKNPQYVENLNFSDFIIDGEDVRGNTYNTSGKGFMINLCKDCHWNNIVVRNTDGTGFGMDNVINGSITNCTAINCGKNATTSDGGASGFGIGTGYSNEESMYISNCKAIGNKKFGFFFEHQGIFSDYYNATQSEGFVVVDSYASGNLYNYGGERANDVVYINCKSDRDVTSADGTNVGYTEIDVYFSDHSRRVSSINFSTNNYYDDVVDKSAYYYDAVNWAMNNGITNGISDKKFGLGRNATRAESVTMLWRMTGRVGDVLEKSDLSPTSRKITNINTGFNDVAGASWYASAVKWAVDNGITNGTSSTTFSPDSAITRSDFITMIWRYAGSPNVTTNNIFSDVSSSAYYYDAVRWAYSKGIVKGISGDKFSPLDSCTREQVVTFLYRYQNATGIEYPINYLLFDGNISGNKNSYISGLDTFSLKNPTKSGYNFVGWIGSNGSNPAKNVTISKNDVGNKTYVAVFEKKS